jgi:hypothetical protein
MLFDDMEATDAHDAHVASHAIAMQLLRRALNEQAARARVGVGVSRDEYVMAYAGTRSLAAWLF